MSEMIQVPDGWEVEKVSSLCKILDNQRIPLNDEERQNMKGYIPYYGANAIVDYIDNYLFDEDLILLAEDGGNFDEYENRPIAFKISGKSWVNNHAHILKPNKNIEFDYVFYSLEHKNISSYIRGGTRSKLNQSDLRDVDVLIPKEKKEQEKIAKILSTLDKAIESTNRLIEKEKNIKTALMQELLTNGIDKNGQIRSPQTHTYKQSELGLIPDEWEIKNIEDIADVFGGGTPDRSNNDFWKNGTVFWATPTDITGISNSNYLKDTKEKITEKGLSGSSAKLLPVGSILLTSRATIGERKISKIPVCTNQGFTSLVPKSNNGIFLYYILDKYISYMYSRAYGTTFPEISRTEVKKISIALPKCETEQKQITKILTTQDKKIQTEETNLAKLKELKKGLMNDLLNGKVRVKI